MPGAQRQMPVSPATNAPPARSTPAATSDVLDFEVLRAFDRIKSDDGSDILIELIDLYLQGTSRRIKEMRRAAGECDWALLKRTAHTLKGSSSTLGLRQIAKTCQALETASSIHTREAAASINLLESQLLKACSFLVAERNRRLGLSH